MAIDNNYIKNYKLPALGNTIRRRQRKLRIAIPVGVPKIFRL